MVNWGSILSSLLHQDRAKIFLSFNWGFLVCCHCHSQAVDFLSSKSGIFKEKALGTHPHVVPWIPGSRTGLPFSLHLSYIHTCSVVSSCMQLHTARQAALSMGLSQQECWSGLSFPPPGDLPDPGIERVSPLAPALQADSFSFFSINSLILFNSRRRPRSMILWLSCTSLCRYIESFH